MLVIVMFFTVIKIRFVLAVFVYGIVIGKLVEKIERFLSEKEDDKHKIESCLQDSSPAAGRFSDTIPFRRSAILAEHFYRIGKNFLYDKNIHKNDRRYDR